MLSADDLLAELRRVVDESGPEVTLFRFRERTGISRHVVCDRWGNWTNLRLAAGLPKRNKPVPVYSDGELLGEFHAATRQRGFFPKAGEFDALSDRSWQTLQRRFGKRKSVIQMYRSWLDTQPESERPGFLADCPPDCDPTPIGVPLIRDPFLDLETAHARKELYPGTFREAVERQAERVAALPEPERQQLWNATHCDWRAVLKNGFRLGDRSWFEPPPGMILVWFLIGWLAGMGMFSDRRETASDRRTTPDVGESRVVQRSRAVSRAVPEPWRPAGAGGMLSPSQSPVTTKITGNHSMDTTNGALNRKLNMGLVGGGPGAFIGRVHVTAAVLDNRAALVAGAFSSDPAKSKAVAPSYDVAADRAYGSFTEMLDQEAQRPDGQRIDFVSITTPNHVHFPVAKAALERGYNVICDKPMTFNLAEAEELLGLVEKSGVVFAVSHNYTGYPLVRQAREMILGGELGEIQAIRSNYIQGWLRTRLESSEQKQAAWRTDPTKSGSAGCFGDIGTHAYNLGRYMTGLLPAEVSCHLKAFESGRALDDYGHAVIRYENGALGTVTASQISHGRENDLFIEVDGTKGALSWRQEEPNVMIVRQNGKPHQMYTRDPNAPFMTAMGKAACRLPSGHPEAFFEAFANVYRFAYDDMVLRASKKAFEKRNTVYPNIYDGVEGMYFIQQCVASSKQNGQWLPLKHPAARK